MIILVSLAILALPRLKLLATLHDGGVFFESVLLKVHFYNFLSLKSLLRIAFFKNDMQKCFFSSEIVLKQIPYISYSGPKFQLGSS